MKACHLLSWRRIDIDITVIICRSNNWK